MSSQVQVVDGHSDEDVVLELHQRVVAEVEEGESRQEAEGAVVDAREAVARQQDLGEVRRRVEKVRQYILDLEIRNSLYYNGGFHRVAGKEKSSSFPRSLLPRLCHWF